MKPRTALRWWTAVIGVLAVLAVTAPATAQAGAPARLAADPPARGGPRVERAVVDELADGQTTDFWIVLERDSDLSGAAEVEDWAERGRYVYDRLVRTARDSQADLTRTLKDEGADFESYWIANRVLVRDADRQTLDDVRAQDGVARIEADDPVALPDPVDERARTTAAGVEWGVANVRADRVWSALGTRGEGVVVGSIDSGVQFDHPALVDQYRGNLGGGKFDHDYNWWDPSRVCETGTPCDNSGHGTHTMGTMVGDDGAGNQIGVAPRARWMTAKGCETTRCTYAALLSSAQFMLAPTDTTGGNPRPELRPQVVSNSWGAGGGDDFYDDMVEAWVAAGMFPVFSNGNEGPGCRTAGSPGDGAQAYGVGAYDKNNAIASFSSRGPGRDGTAKPNVSAPGVAVRSSVPGNGYGSASGTSMAAPHAAGTVALMMSAVPRLAGDVPATRAALDLSAIDTADLTCGGTPENNPVYGQGRLDALGATLRALDDAGVAGRITDDATGAAVRGARILVLGENPPFSTTTGTAGRFQLNLLPGSYDVEISAFGYRPTTLSDVVVEAGSTTTADTALEPLPTGTLTGKVTLDDSGRGVPGATIAGGNVPLTTTRADGTFRVAAPVGTYEVAVEHGMFDSPAPKKATVTEGDDTVVDVVLHCGEECNVDSLWTDRYDGPASSRDIARAVDLSPDGDTMFVTGESPGADTGADTATVAYDPATGERRWEARHDGPGHGDDAGYGIAVSPDGAVVYVTGPSTGTDGKKQFSTLAYDAATGTKKWEKRYDGPGTSDDASLAVDVSPDGGTVAVTGLSDDLWNDYATVMYEATTGDQLWAARYDGPAGTVDAPLAVEFAPDGDTVHLTGYSRPATGVPNDSDYATLSYDAATGEQLWLARYSGPVTGGSDLAQDLRVSPDSSKVFVTGYSASGNRDDAVTLAYDRATGKQLWAARYDGPAHGNDLAFALDLNPDGSTAYVTGRSVGTGAGSDYATIAYDTQNGDQRWVARYNGPAEGEDVAQDVRVSPDGSAVYVSGHSLGVGTDADYATVKYDAATGEERWGARYNGPRDSFDGANALRVSPDSTRVFVTGHSFGVGTSRDYATLAYDADSRPERPVFVPADLRVEPALALSGDDIRVSVDVTNAGTAAGDYEAALTLDGRVQDTEKVSLEPGDTRRVDWTVTPEEAGDHEIGVGHLAAPVRVVGCDQTVTGTRSGELTVAEGVTCLAEGARVSGPVEVREGAGLVATGAQVSGPVIAVDPAVVVVRDSEFAGPITVRGATGGVVLSGNRTAGPVTLADNTAHRFAHVVSGNRIAGPLACTGNTPPPVDEGVPNKVSGQATGQCARL